MVYKDIGLSEVTKELHPDEEKKKKKVKVGMMMRSQQSRLRKTGHQNRRKTRQVWCPDSKKRKCLQEVIIYM